MATEGKHRGQTDVQLDSTPFRPEGTLIVIGGNEAKEGHRPILELIAKRASAGKLVVVTIASEEPEEQWKTYQKTFKALGVARLEQFDARSREELLEQSHPEMLDERTVVFFAGGDQMKITSKFGGTPLCDRLRQLYAEGALIAGTSSGASVMAEVMMAGGESESSQQGKESIRLGPGLGLISGLIIDQHFAERGRMGRLLAGVAQNPRLLGVGIDEDTALIFQGHEHAAVIGSGAVYIVDGRSITHTNASEDADQAISVFGATVHVLNSGDRFDLATRAPAPGGTEDIESQLVAVCLKESTISPPENAGETVTGRRGSLILVGGREDRSGDRTILREIARHARASLFVVATLASEEPEVQWDSYRQAFADLGVGDIRHLHIEGRDGASDRQNLEMIERASVVYFTGGDQLKLAGKLGGTPMLNRIHRLYEERGGVIAGTSAGAAAMGASMLVSHATDCSHKVQGSFFMARGLGLVPDLIIDQHFAQRARIERLVGAVAEDPGVLGIGIDEDTAVILEDQTLRIAGSGAVYVADGQGVTYTNVSERTPDQTLRLYDLRLHVLSHGSTFDLRTRRPGSAAE